MNIFHALHAVFALPELQVAIWGFVCTWLFCILLVLTKRWHGSFSMDLSVGIQKFHLHPTPRIGGLPIVLGLVVAWSQSSAPVQQLLTPILVAGMPAFIFGMAEDITKRVGVTARLLATMASGLLAWWITGYAITRVDIAGVDWLMGFTAVSVVFTAFAVGGVANSINIIDGFNGLSSSMSTLAFVGYAMIAWQVGDTSLAGVALVLAACVWGFFWVNWPFGKLFLGDGGAYFVGFALAWVAVLLIERNPTVSAWAVLTVCVHPVTEVLFSIFRRKVRKDHPGMPDRLHFHSLVKRRYVARWFGQYSNNVRNSITGVLIGFMTLTAVVLASLTHASVAWSVAAFLVLSMGYVAIYARMVKHRWCSPISFLLGKSHQPAHQLV
jgi:UDP-N-acetylmuramyl pentapeptide phosphotransferase/UDP-N-acetylglucosamine-1-phosphate transferase